MTQQLRLGVIGLGNIGQQHIRHVQNGVVPRCVVTAVSSRTGSRFADDNGICFFSDYRELVDSGKCDAVIVATPTMSHKEVGEYALRRGLHVLMEKPIARSVLEGEQLLAGVAGDQVFALMLNQRTDPVLICMKALLEDGRLGEMQRTHWTMTHWFRPEIYFQVSDWRATWLGEGGGLLVNQCIHNLDIFQWLCGMPERVHGFCSFGKYHSIEVEDEATAYFQYGNGATGVFIASTGEAPGINRFDIIGDLGSLSYDGNQLLLSENSPGTASFNKDTHEMFGMPATAISEITPIENVNQHALVLTNFVNAIIDGEALIAPAQEGLDSLALANAILLSSWREQPVALPLDTQAYQKALDERIASSSLREKGTTEAVVDMKKSYR